ncbi:uncharacterized protein LOC120729243 [Simochromis diagramma]|uniref:uncharacterized protein LOC120729243 n=1 Tax=Simochromis diagramma TaxID=43689 RepID=UPI001A7E5C9E|nr:uncharacterized protein LOC120729243 [Simochromis diagramma]
MNHCVIFLWSLSSVKNNLKPEQNVQGLCCFTRFKVQNEAFSLRSICSNPQLCQCRQDCKAAGSYECRDVEWRTLKWRTLKWRTLKWSKPWDAGWWSESTHCCWRWSRRYRAAPRFAQFVPRVPAFVVPAQVGNVYPFPAVPAVNAYQVPFMGVPQMAPMNAPQQPAMGNPAGAAPQQLPVQPDPLGRFRRQIIKAENTVKIPSSTPSASPTAAPCNKDI